MNGFLADVAKKLAERWITLLALPGPLYPAIVTEACVLGQEHALDASRLGRLISGWAAGRNPRPVDAVVLLVVAVLVGSVVVGLLSMVAGREAFMPWTLPGKRPPALRLTTRRLERSRQAKREAGHPAATPERIRSAIARADRIRLVEADRPTWVGDRFRACRIHVERAHGLDRDAIRPRLWLVFSDTTRAEVTTARDAFSASARLMAWALLHLTPAVWWWPTALIAMTIAIPARAKARESTDVLADLVESSVDLHAGELATRLGLPDPVAPCTPVEGDALTVRARTSRRDPDSPLAE